MPQLAALDDVKGKRTQRDLAGGHRLWRTDFIAAPPERPDLPQAFLIESTPHRVLRTHFHEVDQFQVVVKGDVGLAKHKLAVPGVHFARAFTPYGHITNGSEGLSFITLRARRDPGKAQFIPERLDRLKEIAGRKPWQVTEMPQFRAPVDGVAMQTLSGMRDDHGLAGYALSMLPNAKAEAPDAANSDGQFIVVIRGSLVRAGRDYHALSVAFVEAGEAPLPLLAGAQGLEALVLNFPRPQHHTSRTVAPASATNLKTWQCVLCAFVYDEAAGMPEDGIMPGTRWADVPETFGCPDCSATKADFVMVER